mgnify:CR=1 FL=1
MKRTTPCTDSGMPPRPFIAIADDFSGAAEIAGTLHRHGLPVQVTNDLDAELPDAGTALAIDADTRRLTAGEARDRHHALARRLAAEPLHLYKKTDSVLRGHITAELKALLHELPHTQALFCPANPARGRTLANGRYSISGTPLHQTEFSRDPRCPIHSDHATDLLPEFTTLPLDAPQRFPATAGQLLIADASTEQHLQHWAAQLTADQLPAGASPFLAAYLQQLGHRPALTHSTPAFPSPTLLVSGSFSENSRRTATRFKANGWPVLQLADDWTAPLPEAHPAALVKLSEHKLPKPHALPTQLAQWLQQHLASTHTAPAHLLVEGGDTAAAILDAFRWRTFRMLHEWEPGVVTLQPADSSAPPITIKPGSYPWPPEILSCLQS